MTLKKRIINKINIKHSFNSHASGLPFPKKNLLIELTNFCNNKCIFCYNDCMSRKKRYIDKDFCERILSESYDLGMREVGFYVVGEPLLDHRLPYFISFAKEIGYKYIYITTNGILADLNMVKELYSCGLNSIKYSINAINSDDYRLIHKTDNFEKVINNLTSVFDWKRKEKKNIRVYVSCVCVDSTRSEKDIKEFFSNKCDEVVVMPAINQGGLIPDISKISTVQKKDINSNIKYPCPYPFNSVIVTVEGYLTACCMDFENLLAYADLNVVTMEEAWNNSIISDFREKHLKKKKTGTICDNCVYNVKTKPSALCEDLCNIKGNVKFKDIL